MTKRVLKTIEAVGHANVENLPCVKCSIECGSGICEKLAQYISSASQVRVEWEVVDYLNPVLRCVVRLVLILGVIGLVGFICHLKIVCPN